MTRILPEEGGVDWMKIETGLPDKPEVLVMGRMLRLSPDAVVGKLIRLWAWFGAHSVDGRAPAGVMGELDRLTGRKGFCEAMEQAGWLAVEGEDVVVPNWDRHNGQAAKQRRMWAERQARKRRAGGGDVTGDVAGDVTVTSHKSPPSREEKIRVKRSLSLGDGVTEGSEVVGGGGSWEGIVEAVRGIGGAFAGLSDAGIVAGVRGAGRPEAAWRAVRFLKGAFEGREDVKDARTLLSRACSVEAERDGKADAARREEQEAVRRSKEETARRVEEKRARRAVVVAELEAAKRAAEDGSLTADGVAA